MKCAATDAAAPPRADALNKLWGASYGAHPLVLA